MNAPVQFMSTPERQAKTEADVRAMPIVVALNCYRLTMNLLMAVRGKRKTITSEEFKAVQGLRALLLERVATPETRLYERIREVKNLPIEDAVKGMDICMFLINHHPLSDEEIVAISSIAGFLAGHLETEARFVTTPVDPCNDVQPIH